MIETQGPRILALALLLILVLDVIERKETYEILDSKSLIHDLSLFMGPLRVITVPPNGTCSATRGANQE